jgi:hypothetical protein
MEEPYDDRLAAAVQIEIAHGVAETAGSPEAAEDALEVGVAIDRHRFIHWTTQGAADEGGD